MKKGTYISLLAGYAVAVAVYGMWQHFGLPLLPLVFALPVFYLAVVSLVPTKWHGSFMSLGLLMSAAGDYCGESGMFLLQASFFAVAHIFYAVYFLRGAWFRPSSLAAALLLCAAVAVAASRIIPAVGNPTEHGAVVVYAVLITLMCASSFFWKGKGRGWYIAGALLFLISVNTVDLSYLKLALSQRTSLIKYHRMQLCHRLQVVTSLHQNALLRSRTDTREETHRNRNNQRTRAGDNQESTCPAYPFSP